MPLGDFQKLVADSEVKLCSPKLNVGFFGTSGEEEETLVVMLVILFAIDD